jgi:hypothetical protein
MSFFSGVSNFRSRGPYDAFWQHGSIDDPDHFVTCATNGRTFVTVLQSALRTVPSGQTYDGRTVDGSMVQVDGRFGPITAKVLYLAAKNAGTDVDTLAQIQREGVARGSGSTGMTYLLTAGIKHILATTRPGETIGEIHLPEGAQLIPPQWGIASPKPVGWENGPPAGLTGFHCTLPYSRSGEGYRLPIPGETPGTTPPPPGPGETPESAPPPAPTVPTPPPAPERGGPPIGTSPPGPEDLPPGVTVRPVEEVGGVSWPVIGVGVAAVVVVSLLGLSLMRAPVAKETQLRRPSRRRRYATAA